MSEPLRPGDRVIWWKYISGDVEYPFRATVLETNPKRVKVLIDDTQGGSDTVVRHVAPERVHQVGSYFTRLDDQKPMMFEPMASWGRYVQFTEVGEDLFAVRNIFCFENGDFLSYDRSHWVDDFGTLGDARINRNRKDTVWGHCIEIEEGEFEEVWEAARNSPTWHRQKETGKMFRYGATPIWLSITLWKPRLLGTPRNRNQG